MTGVGFTVDAGALARTIANALAFCPARSAYPVVRLTVSTGRVDAIATDTYAVGSDWAEARTTGALAVVLERADAQALEKMARGERGGDLIVTFGEADPLGGRMVTVVTLGGVDLTRETLVRGRAPYEPTARDGHGTTEADLFAALDGLMGRLDDEVVPILHDGPIPLDIYFTPSILMAFSKVKSSGDTPTLGMRIYDPTEPLLVKIGPSFRGAIMPVVPEKAEPEYRAEMLW